MKKLNRKIKNIYSEQVRPEYHPDAWSQFELYRSNSDNTRGYISYWPRARMLIMLGLLSFLCLLNWDTQNIDLELFQSQPSIDVYHVPLELEEPDIINIEERNISTVSPVIYDLSIMNVKRNENEPGFVNHSAKVQSEFLSVEKNILDYNINPMGQNELSAHQNDAIGVLVWAKERHIEIPELGRASVSSIERVANRRIDIPRIDLVDKAANIGEDPKFGLSIITGTAFSTEYDLVDDQAFQVGGILSYRPANGLRLSSEISLQSVSFLSREVNQKIGIKAVEMPSDHLILSEIIVESASLVANLGIDFTIYKSDFWALYAGASYGYYLELSRELEYKFDDDDEITPSVSLFTSNKISSPHLFQLHSGIEFEANPILTFGLRVSRVLPINNPTYVVPNNTQISLVLTTKF